jgi:hypothetical protein
MRRLMPLALIALLAVAVPALAVSSPTYKVHVPAKFKGLLPEIKSKSGLDVRLPSTIPSYVKARSVYPNGSATRKSYDLELGAGKNCNGANACFIAAFQATRGGKPAFRTKVSLVNGITGYFKPVTCGASCSPSFIQWKEGKVLYEIELKGLASSKEKSGMKKLANSAIRGGDR